MSLDTSDILGDSLYRTFSRNGLVLIVGAYFASLLGMIGLSSAVFDGFESLWDDLVEEEPDLAEFFDGPADFLPLAFDMPSWAALGLLAAGIVLGLIVLVVALRVFYAGLDDELPSSIILEHLGWASVNLLVGGFIFSFLWGIGLALFVIPGIIIFVLLVYFSAGVAVDNQNFVDAFARSVSITKGERLSVFVLFLAVWLIAIAVSIAFTIVGAIFILVSPIASELVSLIAQSMLLVYFAAVIATSYRHLMEGPEAAPSPDDDDSDDDDDDPFEEFTPASQTAQW